MAKTSQSRSSKSVSKSSKAKVSKPTKKAVKSVTKAIAKKPASLSKSKSQVSSKKDSSKSKSSKVSCPGGSITKNFEVCKNYWDYFLRDGKYQKYGFATKAIHAGNEPDPVFGGVAPLLDLSSTFAQHGPGVPYGCFDYARCGNPTRLALERNLAAMEKCKYAFACHTGMSATQTIFSLLKDGDHILCIDDVYGGTQRYLRKCLLPTTNITLDMIDMSNIQDVKNACKENTKIVWLETPTNPTLKVFDISKIGKVCHERGILFVVDNTFMSPVLQNPMDQGADVVMHSISKYINGHSDLIMGCLCLNDKALFDKLFFNLKTLGTGASPFDCWLALRGTKTLELRVNRAAANGLACAKYLEKHPKIVKCIYPGLESHPQHKIAKKQTRGPGNGGSGMVSIYVKGDMKNATKFLKALKVFTLAESLGGVESLIEHPASMTHGSVPADKRKILGIDDNFIRMSVGCESIEDLIADLKSALDQA